MLDPGETLDPNAPPPIVAPPPAAAPVATAANDPSYIDLLAQLTRQRHDAIVGFGDAAGTGADADTAAQAAANPYSVTHNLAQMLTHNISGINNNANAHGVLFSGANVQGQQNEYAAGAQRNYDAHKALLDALNSLADQQHSAYWAAQQRLLGGLTSGV